MKVKIGEVIFKFQRKVFEWVKRRDNKHELEWSRWLIDPNMT